MDEMAKSHDKNCEKDCAICLWKCSKRLTQTSCKTSKSFSLKRMIPFCLNFRQEFVPLALEDYMLMFEENFIESLMSQTISTRTELPWTATLPVSGAFAQFLIVLHNLPRYVVIIFMKASVGCAHPNHQCISGNKIISNHVELIQSKGNKTFG